VEFQNNLVNPGVFSVLAAEKTQATKARNHQISLKMFPIYSSQ
jgi:sulfur relay (sulfurtransferase) DsrF/TusC family protein